MAPPNIPNGSSEIERAEYKRIKPYLERIGCSELDRAALLGYLSAYRLMVESAANMQKHGYYINVGNNGYQSVSPHLSAYKSASEMLLRYIKELGFSNAKLENNELVISDEEL